MKQPLLFWFLVFLICVSLSCNLFTPGQLAGVTSVTVDPQSGSGSFTASVKGEAHKGSTLWCYIPVDDENGNRVGTVDAFRQENMSSGDIDTFSFSYDFAFTYTVAGKHSLICTLGTSDQYAWSADFTVTSGSGSGQSEGQPLPEQFKTATLYYLTTPPPSNQTAPGKGAPPFWCFTGDISGGASIPPLTISPDGSFKGDCTGGFTLYSKTYTWGGTTAGQWDPQTGLITWTMNMWIKIEDPSSGHITTRTIAIQGSSPISTAADGTVSANGTAAWTDTCQADNSDIGYIPCDSTTAYNWSGTLDWKMTFNP